MKQFEFIATKSDLPKYLNNIKEGFINAKNEKKAELKLERHYLNVLIIREV